MGFRSAITGRFVKGATGKRWPKTTTKESEYPYRDGDVLVIGPQAFMTLDGKILNYKGVYYMRQEDKS